MFDFDLLTPAKKISLCASAAVAYLMLTAFVASLTESAANIEWACWLGYYSILGYGVMLVAGGLDLRTNYKDMCPGRRRRFGFRNAAVSDDYVHSGLHHFRRRRRPRLPERAENQHSLFDYLSGIPDAHDLLDPHCRGFHQGDGRTDGL